MSDTAAWLAPSRGMAAIHNSFKAQFENNHRLADGTFHTQGMSLAGFLHQARNVSASLDGHHRAEEARIFPILAAKHPAFRPDNDHVKSHRVIHAGLERYNKYIADCVATPGAYNSHKFRAVIDSFKKPLYDHLDQEVRDLEPLNLKKHGVTLSEVKQLPFR